MPETSATPTPPPIVREYFVKLPTISVDHGRAHQRYPRSWRFRVMRGLLRFWLLPIQVGLALLTLAALLELVTMLAPQLFGAVLTTAHQDLVESVHSATAWFFAPLAAVLLRYPWQVAVAFALIFLILLRLDGWARHDRKRERNALAVESPEKWRSAGPRLLGDIPYQESDDDARKGVSDPLGYVGFVNVAYHLIQNSAPNTPLAISIEAKWGMGKTSIMTMLEQRLRNRRFELGKERWRCFTVNFNAWKYSGADMQRALVSRIFEARPPRRVPWLLRPSARKELLRLGLEVTSRVARLGSAGELVSAGFDPGASFRDEAEVAIKHYFEHVREVERRKPLLIVFVDDLDRCEPYEVRRTFGMIKLLFDLPGCVFVIGYDPAKVTEALQRADIHRDGNDFLKKIIQLTYALPKPEEQQFRDFVDASIEDAGLRDFFEHALFQRVKGNYPQLIMEGTGYNPREVRRFLNAMVVSTEIAGSRKDEDSSRGPETSQPSAKKPLLLTDIDRIALALVMLLQTRWPDAYLRFKEHAEAGSLPSFIEEMYTYLRAATSTDQDGPPQPAAARGEAASHEFE